MHDLNIWPCGNPVKPSLSRTNLNGFRSAQAERSKGEVFDIEHLASSVVVSVEQSDSSHALPKQSRKIKTVSRFQLQGFGGILPPTADAAAPPMVPNISLLKLHESLIAESARLCWCFIRKSGAKSYVRGNHLFDYPSRSRVETEVESRQAQDLATDIFPLFGTCSNPDVHPFASRFQCVKILFRFSHLLRINNQISIVEELTTNGNSVVWL
jgi:hypothetical protein